MSEVSTPREWILRPRWQRPPLTANQRMHWAEKAALTREVRGLVKLLARVQVPALSKCEVTLYWSPPDRRRRDADNLVATLKACCDGIVDAGIVKDDTPAYMVKRMPVITEPSFPPRMWIVVREVVS